MNGLPLICVVRKVRVSVGPSIYVLDSRADAERLISI